MTVCPRIRFEGGLIKAQDCITEMKVLAIQKNIIAIAEAALSLFCV